MSRRTSIALIAVIALLGIAAVNPLTAIDQWRSEARAHGHKLAYAPAAQIPTETVTDAPCVDGIAAGEFACNGVDLLSFMPSSEFGGLFGATGLLGVNDVTGLVSGNSDVWGWTSPSTGEEYAMMGHTQGVAFFRVNDGVDAEYLGSVMNTAPGQLIWHDIKVVNDTAMIASESVPHGIQMFDLTLLDSLPAAPTPLLPLPPTGFYPLSIAQHNVVVNDDTDRVYIVGGGSIAGIDPICGGGLEILDYTADLTLVPAGCYDAEGYVHDAECVVYEGPDAAYAGREVCLLFAEEEISIVDVTDAANPETINVIEYDFDAYTHQGWFSADFRYIIANDELDETDMAEVTATRTLVVAVEDDLAADITEDDVMYFMRDGSDGNPRTVSIDHNNYATEEGLLFQSNYTSGLRVIDLAGLDATDDEGNPTPRWDEVAFFDTYPTDDEMCNAEDAEVGVCAVFEGTWSNYPYFESGIIPVSGIGEGIFFLRLQDGVVPADGEADPGTGGGVQPLGRINTTDG